MFIIEVNYPFIMKKITSIIFALMWLGIASKAYSLENKYKKIKGRIQVSTVLKDKPISRLEAAVQKLPLNSDLYLKWEKQGEISDTFNGKGVSLKARLQLFPFGWENLRFGAAYEYFETSLDVFYKYGPAGSFNARLFNIKVLGSGRYFLDDHKKELFTKFIYDPFSLDGLLVDKPESDTSLRTRFEKRFRFKVNGNEYDFLFGPESKFFEENVIELIKKFKMKYIGLKITGNHDFLGK